MRLCKYLVTALSLLFCFESYATWSIIVIDQKTKEIGIAAASCTYNCYGIGKIVRGKGAIIVQAMSNQHARDFGETLLISGVSPSEIIEKLRDSRFDPERQQYSVATFEQLSLPATYTGELTNSIKGAMAMDGISVQGNTLANEDEVSAIFSAAKVAKEKGLRIDEILMAALDAGAKLGGDKRCGEQKASTAFAIVMKPDLRKTWMKLHVFGQPKGGPNAVELLKKQYEKWKKKRKLTQS